MTATTIKPTTRPPSHAMVYKPVHDVLAAYQKARAIFVRDVAELLANGDAGMDQALLDGKVLPLLYKPLVQGAFHHARRGRARRRVAPGTDATPPGGGDRTDASARFKRGVGPSPRAPCQIRHLRAAPPRAARSQS